MTSLEAKVKDLIRREGPMTFHDLMAAALYDPDDGYYAKGPKINGPASDFSTSVAFEAFRDAIARVVAALPSGYRVVELGAGTGQLAQAVTEWVPHIEYITVDASAGLRAKQSAIPGVRSVASMAELEPGPTLVMGNEVLDALPVRRIVGGAQEGDILEVVVTLDEAGKFKERLAPVEDPRIAERFKRIGVWPQRGQVCDVAPALEEFVREAARIADPGFLLFIDYGDPANILYAPTRLNGTLAVYRSHGRYQDPYAELGKRDITADVDFTAVELAATDAGMEPLALVMQQHFLERLGVVDDFVARPSGLGTAFLVFGARRGTTAMLPGL